MSTTKGICILLLSYRKYSSISWQNLSATHRLFSLGSPLHAKFTRSPRCSFHYFTVRLTFVRTVRNTITPVQKCRVGSQVIKNNAELPMKRSRKGAGCLADEFATVAIRSAGSFSFSPCKRTLGLRDDSLCIVKSRSVICLFLRFLMNYSSFASAVYHFEPRPKFYNVLYQLAKQRYFLELAHCS